MALLSRYVVTIAILMLNLLIAVLSTVQEAIQEQVHTEFQLARNRIVQRQAHVVEKGRFPLPFDLVLEESWIS